MTTFVQSKSNGSTGSATSLAVTLDYPVTVGNTLLVFLFAQTATVSSVGDGLSNVYTQDFSNTVTNGDKYAYSAPVTNGGACTVTWSFLSNLFPREMIVVEHKNLSASPFDVSAIDTSVAAAAGNNSGTTAGLAQNFELVVGIAAPFNNDNTLTFRPGFTHTIREATGGATYRLHYADQLVNSLNGQFVDATSTAAGGFLNMICLTYKYTPKDPIRPNNLRPHVFSPGLAR